jgi:hypothetical protein
MLVSTQNEKNTVSQYLNGEFVNSNKTCKSSYFAALLHARELGGRCIKSGSIERVEQIGSWPSACLYLTLIDHVGNIFAKKSKISNSPNSFLKALESFTSLEEEERKTLYQLRCSFLHQFNLYNVGNSGYEDRHFIVHRGQPLIVFPKEKFSGDLSKISSNNATLVSLPEIANLVESIHTEITSLLLKNELEINVPNGITLEQYLKANIFCYESPTRLPQIHLKKFSAEKYL